MNKFIFYTIDTPYDFNPKVTHIGNYKKPNRTKEWKRLKETAIDKPAGCGWGYAIESEFVSKYGKKPIDNYKQQ